MPARPHRDADRRRLHWKRTAATAAMTPLLRQRLLVACIVACQSILFWTPSEAFSSRQAQSWQPAPRSKVDLYTRQSLPLSSLPASSVNDEPAQEGIRLNKVFKETHSRREADKLIASGRVSVNGEAVESKGGFKVVPFRDEVALDGKLVKGWEEMNAIPSSSSSLPLPSKSDRLDHFEFVKYWKKRGTTCTTDRSIRGNLIDEIARDGYRPKQRVYPVGRLDKDTSGLILLTSDGRLPNAALRGRHKQPKIYEVFVDKPIKEGHVQRLRDGIVITTVAQRDGNRAKPLTAKTLPCRVERIDRYGLRIALVEGRNRQIRKMLGALEYTVVELHRVQFMGIALDPLKGTGDWKALDTREMKMLQNVLRSAAAAK